MSFGAAFGIATLVIMAGALALIFFGVMDQGGDE